MLDGVILYNFKEQVIDYKDKINWYKGEMNYYKNTNDSANFDRCYHELDLTIYKLLCLIELNNKSQFL